MKQEYINRIPQEFHFLVEEIESHINDEIYVKVDGSRPHKLACNLDNYKATILIPTEDYFPEASVLHELLHIRRFCVNKVPLIVVCDNCYNWSPSFEANLISLDDNIEHFIIVPEEIGYRPNRKEYWKTCLRNRIDNLIHSTKDNQDLGFDALLYWIFINHIFPEDDFINKIDNAISAHGIKERAQKFQKEFIAHLSSKEKLVKVCTTCTGLSDDDVCIEYKDFKNKSSHEKSLNNVNL